jgi:hypothetical protein
MYNLDQVVEKIKERGLNQEKVEDIEKAIFEVYPQIKKTDYLDLMDSLTSEPDNDDQPYEDENVF